MGSRRGRLVLSAIAAVAAGAVVAQRRRAATAPAPVPRALPQRAEYERPRAVVAPEPIETVAEPVWLSEPETEHRRHPGWRRKPKPKGAVRRSLRVPIAVLIGLAILLVPWAIPGFANRVSDLVGASPTSQPAIVNDPSVLPDAPTGPAHRTPPFLTGRLKAAGAPTRVVVPRLQVNSPVVAISGSSGLLLPPSDPLMLGWWMQGPQPGSAQGTAILTGHTVHTGGGALDHLASLVPGDRFKVQTDAGTITYVVTKVQKYSKGDLAQESQGLFRLTGVPRVFLVTCSGWTGTVYLDNTVVIGAPISEVAS